MLTILIFAMVIQILAKGRDSPFILKDPAKSMKKHIDDPVRRKILVGMVVDAKRKYRKYQKRMKAYANVLKVLISDTTTSKDELNAIFEAMLAGVYHDQEARILGRIKGLDFIREDEFSAIIKESVAARNDARLENEKKWITINDAFDKSLQKINKIIIQVVTDKERQEQAVEILSTYKTAMHAQIYQMAAWNYRDNQVLSNYHSTEEELLQTTRDLNLHRRKIYDAFVELYLQLTESLDEHEWSSTSKLMKSLL